MGEGGEGVLGTGKEGKGSRVAERTTGRSICNDGRRVVTALCLSSSSSPSLDFRDRLRFVPVIDRRSNQPADSVTDLYLSPNVRSSKAFRSVVW